MSRYLDLLLAANARMNLTRIVDPKSAEILHVGDSLMVLPYLPAGAHRLADVGSGGGVPGIVLAIARPDAQITLIEATKKKAEFLKSAANELGLANVTVAPIRAEEAGRSELRETFDVALARAVGTLDWLAEWMLPLVKNGGVMLAMK
ncbi:MAG: 16S rRNA (guanine(527)-N(7))-methyltransferase RsmG, partial [Tepidisphaeraceae bacterium]